MVNDIKTRKSETVSRIPTTWMSEDYLQRCFERKGGVPKGTITTFREQWGRKGKPEVGWI